MLGRGQFPPGSRVSTLELSKRLGISRTPVREALSQLASQGLVRDMPGFGVYVQIPQRQELEELYAMREIVEVYATSEAVKHINEGELAQLEMCCEHLLALARHLRSVPGRLLSEKEQARWIKADEKFHTVLLTAARNGLVLKVAKDMRLISRTLDMRRPESALFITLGAAAQTYRQHAALVRAIRKRDAAAADYWIKRQIRAGRERHLADVEAYLDRRSEETRASADESLEAGTDGERGNDNGNGRPSKRRNRH
jgi:DNA-binding GntR family transcriptional regulator